jgi:hypothetical protein
MLKAWMILVAVALVGCDKPVYTDIAVGPDASEKWTDIVAAVDMLNEELGEDVFTVSPATGDGRVDGHATIEIVDNFDEPGLAGQCHRKVVKGTVHIQILRRTKPHQIAHELGHAAGLDHVEDPGNLMYDHSARMWLDDGQREYLLGLL